MNTFKDDSIAGLMNEMKKSADEILEDRPQQDRTLSNGKIKTATGYVEDPVSENIRDIPGYGRAGF